MRLGEYQGNKATVGLLRRLLSVGRLPPAILLDGPAGIGRRTLALALAQAILCPEQADGDACGQCQSCRLVSEGNHPDCSVLPHEREQADIPVDAVRDGIVLPAQESPLMGHGRAFIIPGVERLRGPAANALLKVLEEPPAGSHLIMTTRHADSLLPTILSRAQVFRLQRLAADEIATILRRGGVAIADAEERARLAAGSHRGLWDDELGAVPFAELRRLLADGYDAETVAAIMDALPQEVGDVAKGATVAGEQRRIIQLWFDALIEDLRPDLRGEQAPEAARQIEHVLQLRGDLGRYIQPRLIIEALGLVANPR